MASDLRTTYCELVTKRYDSKAHAYWPDDPTIQIGDYGRFDGVFFQKHGNLFDESIVSSADYPVNTGGPAVADIIFTSGCQYGLKAGGEASDAVTVQIDFASDKSLLVYAHNLQNSSLNGIDNLRKLLISRVKSGEWDRSNVVVTELLTAENLKYYLYTGGKGTLDLKAKVSPDSFNIKQNFGQLAINASAGLKTDMFHECTYSANTVFTYKMRRLVKPIMDLMGNPKLEVQAAADDYASNDSPSIGTSPDHLVLGEV